MRDPSTDDARRGRMAAAGGSARVAPTGRDIIGRIGDLPELTWKEAQIMMSIAVEDREADARDQYDLR